MSYPAQTGPGEGGTRRFPDEPLAVAGRKGKICDCVHASRRLLARKTHSRDSPSTLLRSAQVVFVGTLMRDGVSARRCRGINGWPASSLIGVGESVGGIPDRSRAPRACW